MSRIGAALATASGVPTRASAKLSERVSTTAAADPEPGKLSCDTRMAVAMRSIPPRRMTGFNPDGVGAAPMQIVVATTIWACVPKSEAVAAQPSAGP